MSTAIKPSFLPNVPILEKKASANGASDEELALYALSNTNGWKVFREIALQTSSELTELSNEAIAQGAPLEEIGRNAVVVSLAQGIIKKLLNKVDDAVEACETSE